MNPQALGYNDGELGRARRVLEDEYDQEIYNTAYEDGVQKQAPILSSQMLSEPTKVADLINRHVEEYRRRAPVEPDTPVRRRRES